ncbi:MAG: response regulator transcription factor [Acidobacteria bacterium]|nr:response regulator transcription factor [Acidobacteriota bacterium]
MLRILLIENQTLTRIGIRTVLAAQKDIELAGEAATGGEGFGLFRALRPDVTILGLRLPDSCAIDTLDDYFAADRRAKILVLADTAGDAEIGKALKKGALGFICKDVEPAELVKALRTIAAGKKYIPSDIAEILSQNYGSEELTATETRILREIVAGKSNKEIAYDLDVSENTVKTHVKNIFEKLNVSDRTSAATVAIRRGLVRIHL